MALFQYIDGSVWVIVFLVIIGFFLVKGKINKQKQKVEDSKELLRFFGPDDRLKGSDIQMRVEQLTGGKRKPGPTIYFQLEKLVKAGFLCKEKIKPYPEEAPDLEIVRYFLPKP